MTKSSKPRRKDYSQIDIYDLLEQRRQVAVIWETDDVLEVRPDLTDEQAWEVLKECKARHDCQYGFTWDLIEIIADNLFPRPDGIETSEEGD